MLPTDRKLPFICSALVGANCAAIGFLQVLVFVYSLVFIDYCSEHSSRGYCWTETGLYFVGTPIWGVAVWGCAKSLQRRDWPLVRLQLGWWVWHRMCCRRPPPLPPRLLRVQQTHADRAAATQAAAAQAALDAAHAARAASGSPGDLCSTRGTSLHNSRLSTHSNRSDKGGVGSQLRVGGSVVVIRNRALSVSASTGLVRSVSASTTSLIRAPPSLRPLPPPSQPSAAPDHAKALVGPPSLSAPAAPVAPLAVSLTRTQSAPSGMSSADEDRVLVSLTRTQSAQAALADKPPNSLTGKAPHPAGVTKTDAKPDQSAVKVAPARCCFVLEDAFWAGFVLTPREALQQLFHSVQVVMLLSALLSYSFIFAASMTHDDLHDHAPAYLPGWIAVATSFFTIAIMTTPRFRGWMQAHLATLGGLQAETNGAASVAALLGGVDQNVALARATRQFRGLPISEMSESDFETNAPATGLFERTLPMRLGQVDAFVSHSWHDDPHLKWDALSAWATGFEADTGREPVIWFDRACIDQNDIANALACLPIFLSGCSQLVCIVGPTYVTRLWAIMEVFTFLRMGGDVSRIVLLPIEGDTQEAAHLAPTPPAVLYTRTLQRFRTFDVRNSTCFLPQERERLVSCIEAAFGDCRNFNGMVQRIFGQRRPRMGL